MLLEREDTAMQQIFFNRAKSIVGTVLVGLGIFIFYENLHQAAAQVSQVLRAFHGETPGESPLILAAMQVSQAYAAGHHQVLQVFLLHALASLWPMLLVLAGTVLTRDCPTDKVSAPAWKALLTCRSDPMRFDVGVDIRLISTQKEKHQCGSW
jgi:hypothetical protein